MAETLTLVHTATGKTRTISAEKGFWPWFMAVRFWFAAQLALGNYPLGILGILLIAAVVYFGVATDDNKAAAGCAAVAYLAIGTYVAFKRTDLLVQALRKQGWTLKNAQ